MSKAKCLLCDDVIESTHVHDFVTCYCGNLSLDGGDECIRVLYKEPDSFQHIKDEESE